MTQAENNRKKVGVAVWSVGANVGLIVVKVAVGVLMGSVSVISEAIHSGVDLLAAVIALVAVQASARKADERHPYGHGKYENVSGTIEALLIFLAAAWIIYEAVHKLIKPQPVELPFWGAGVMLVSVIVNFVIAQRLFKVGKQTESVALQADAWHHRTDIYTSAGVMLGLVVIWIVGAARPGTDVHWVDPVVAMLVAVMILKAAWDLTRESARDLIDTSLPEKDTEWIAGFVTNGWPQVRSFHNLRTRKAGSQRFIDFHLAVDDRMSVGEAHRLGDEIVAALKERVPECRVGIHVEPCEHECKESCVSGCLVSPQQRATGQAKHSGSEE